MLEIWRQKNKDTKGFFRTYLYETASDTVTVAAALSELNERETLFDIDGNVSDKIVWECTVISDLMVNRQIVFDNLKRMQLWSESEIFADDRNNSVMYEASRCLQCGCCLEVCPNFALGGSFFGMSAMVPSSRLLAGMKGSSFNRLRKQYGKVITDGCGKSLACRNVCPAGIDIEGLMARSNAAVLWKWFSRG